MIKLSFQELAEGLIGEKIKFPKYTSWILNQVNRISQATRPRIVGQMSELIKQCPERSFEGWKRWYLKTHPDAIKNATQRISSKLKEVKDAFDEIDEELIKKWVEDLVLIKTFLGLRIQEAVLKKLAEMKGVKPRLATPQEESKGIDGYIGDIPISIKPRTYKLMKHLQDNIDVKIILYEKKHDGVLVDASEVLNEQKTLRDVG